MIQRALITGAGRGIGKAIAEALASYGIEVILVARNEAEITALKNSITKSGGKAEAYTCDIRDADEVSSLAKNIGAIDILINNAGIAPSAKIEETTDEMWSDTLATNVSGPFYLSRAFVPSMKEAKHGIIINIASTAALEGFAYTSAYSASKHALLGLARALEVELKRYGIHVATVCPGFVRTDIFQSGIDNIVERTGKSTEQAEAELAMMNRSGKIIKPNEVADVVLKIIEGIEMSSVIVL